MNEGRLPALAGNRLRVVFVPQAPDADGRRLWLRQTNFAGRPLKDAELRLHVGDMQKLDRANAVWERTMCGHLAHIGSWARYRQEIACARAVHGALGWTLSDDEARLTGYLEVIAAASAA